MRAYALTHLSDAVLLRDLATAVAQERGATAVVLAHIAEVDARKLYVPAGYPSMFAFCVGELHLSEDAAYKRIQAARAARQFPAILPALADGRLHLTGLGLLAPHLTEANADELLAAAAHRSKSEIDRLLAQRFPRPELMAMLQVVPAAAAAPQLAPAQVGTEATGPTPGQLAPAHVAAPVARPRLAPLAAERFALQLTIGQQTYDKLQYAQALLSHAVPSGDLAEVLDRALDVLIGKLERTKFAATSNPRPRQRPSARERHVPAPVMRAVWERDQGRCTFVSETGHRCAARKFVEFDHIEPVARGGEATAAGLRLRCRAHNQYQAERTFGAEFMRHKRQAAREAAAEARARAVADDTAREVMAGLRSLGFKAEEARRAAAFSSTLAGQGLEERMRAALKFLCPKPPRACGAAPPSPCRDRTGSPACGSGR